MTIWLASYLKRNRFSAFYFRRVVPSDLREFFAFKEVARSTGAASRREPFPLVRRMGASLDLLFGRMREMVKGKKADDKPLKADLIVLMEFEKDGTIKSLKTEARPDENKAAGRLVPQPLNAAGGARGRRMGGLRRASTVRRDRKISRRAYPRGG